MITLALIGFGIVLFGLLVWLVCALIADCGRLPRERRDFETDGHE